MTKVFLFGIDGAPPELVFGSWKDALPNINKLMNSGSYARLNSTIPPSTIVAWNAMLSGKDSSQIGVFSYTKKDKYGQAQLVHSKDIQCDLMWDILGKQKKSIALFVPLSYPVKPINGVMVSDFLTPMINDQCAYPEHILKKVKAVEHPDIFFDVVEGLAGHKGLELSTLIERTYKMTDMQVSLIKDLIVNEPWDFFATVMIGTDRLQHMVWNHFDETHKKFVPNSPHKTALKDYYTYLDKKLGEILTLLDEDTVVIVASDHGMIKQEGKININNWLLQEGYLVLKNATTERTRFSTDFVDMDKSIAYGGGAYNARININKAKVGKNYDQILDEIAEKLKKIPDDHGKPLNTLVYKTKDIYADTSHPECPDLVVYFDDLRWASNPDLGQEGLYSWKTAVGADTAGHSRQGCFVISGKHIAKKSMMHDLDIQQVAPTILKLFGVKVPEDIKISPIDLN